MYQVLKEPNIVTMTHCSYIWVRSGADPGGGAGGPRPPSSAKKKKEGRKGKERKEKEKGKEKERHLDVIISSFVPI